MSSGGVVPPYSPSAFRLWVSATESGDYERIWGAPCTEDTLIAAHMLSWWSPLKYVIHQGGRDARRIQEALASGWGQ